jgi:hypothetical protein
VSEKRGPFPWFPLIAVPVIVILIEAIDRLTHSDVDAAIATIVILGAYIAWWLWRRRHS